MKRIAFCLLMSLTLLFSTSCRKNLMDLHNSNDGSLSVSVGVNRSLYQGEYLQDGSGRFVGPTSESISLSYIVGEQEYTTTLELELSTDGDSLTGTATLSGLPVGVEGVVNVSTYNLDGQILCDDEELMVLTSGDNTMTLTLSISELSPFLNVGNIAEYLNELLQPGDVLYIMLPGLQGGESYQMHIYQEVESPEPPDMAVITADGDVIELTDIVGSDFGGLEFTMPAGEETAIVCFHNPHDYEVPGLIWVDKPSEYTSVSYNTKVVKPDPYAQYWRITNGYGKLYSTDQAASITETDAGGLKESSDGGSTWTLYPLFENALGTDSNFEARVADIYFRNGLVYCLINQRLSISTAPPDPYDDIGVAVYNASDGSAAQQYTTWQSTGVENNSPIENYRIAVSDTTVFVAYLTSTDDLSLLAGSTTDSPNKGTLSVPSFSSSGTTTDELQICALGDDLYIYADKDIYRWTAGSAALDLVFSLENGSPDNFRYLSVYRNKYILASNALESRLYIPEVDTVYPFVDYDELQGYVNPDLFTITQATTASENYFFNLSTIRTVGELSIVSLNLSVLGNGGYQDIGEVTLTSDLPVEIEGSYILKKIFADESTGKIYVCGIENLENSYFIYSFDLQ